MRRPERVPTLNADPICRDCKKKIEGAAMGYREIIDVRNMRADMRGPAKPGKMTTFYFRCAACAIKHDPRDAEAIEGVNKAVQAIKDSQC
jgi:hypothetical protein